jgi:UDP-2,3-diacylglucosamine pyrophosphatase LpxH
MGNHRRLTKLFNNAERIKFSNADKFVFFSDVHRGNNSWADEFAINETIYSYAIQHYFDAGFIYVEVGDGDELLKFKHVEEIRIAHEHVYRILQKFHKKSRFYFIFGNHDIEYRNPEIVQKKLNWLINRITDKKEVLFENFKIQEALVFQHDESGIELFVVHGHQGDDLFHRFIWLNRVLLRTFWRPLQLMGFQDPSSIAQNMNKRQKVEEQLIKWAGDHNQLMLCGHTHKERFPKKHKPPYFNDGSCVHPRWITCIEIADGKIALVRWRIKPNKKGHLVVKRTVLKGPKQLDHFSGHE